jgi:hypothetical protein
MAASIDDIEDGTVMAALTLRPTQEGTAHRRAALRMLFPRI